MLERREEYAAEYDICRRVWQRVDPQQDPYPEESCGAAVLWQEWELLEELAGRKQQRRQLYRACVRQAPTGAARQKLNRLAAEKEGQVRRLLAVVFLLTGQRRTMPVVEQRKQEPWRQMLRESWFEEHAGARQLEDLAGRLPEWRDLLMEQAEEDRRHAGQLLSLLAQSLA